MSYWVETKAAYFTCPVKFDTFEAAKTQADRWRADGAFVVRIYELREGEYSGTLVYEV